MIRFVLKSCSNGDTEAGTTMFESLYFILIKYQLRCQVSNDGTDVVRWPRELNALQLKETTSSIWQHTRCKCSQHNQKKKRAANRKKTPAN